MTNKEHEIFMRKLFDEKLDEAFDRGCVNMVQKLIEYFTKYGITLNVNNWMNNYSQGYDTARNDIQDFAKKQYEKFNDRTQWDAGYRHAMGDVMEYIERM